MAINGYNLETLTARLHSLEESVSNIQKVIRRKQLEGFEPEDIYFRVQNAEFVSGKLFDKHIKVIDNTENYSVIKNSQVTKQFSGVSIMGKSVSERIFSSIKKIKRNLLFNVLWVLVHVIAVIASVYYIKTAFDSWQSSPVVQATSSNQVSVENIPFPAITICRPFQFNRDYDFKKHVGNCLDCKDHVCNLKNKTCEYTDLETLIVAFNMCIKYALANQFEVTDEMYMDGIVKKIIDEDELKTYMRKLIPKCSYDLVYTRPYGIVPFKKVTRCDEEEFQHFLSYQYRTCMTFNSLRHKDIFRDNVVTPIPMADTEPKENFSWTFDNMMTFNGGLHTVPIYGLMNQYSILFGQPEENHENLCSFLPDDIATVTVHSPNEIPYDASLSREILVTTNKGVDITLTPRITLARDLAQYSPHQRGCYFVHEKKLTMFKYYTKNNCNFECLVLGYLSLCNCVPFMYPRPNNTVQVCVVECGKPLLRCECLPECNSLSYEVTQQEMSITGLVVQNISLMGVVDIKFSSDKYYTNIRYSITSIKEFLAYTLGVLGAFLGFSVTCVWKLVYLGIARLCKYIRKPGGNDISPLIQHKDLNTKNL